MAGNDDSNWGQYLGYGFQIAAGVVLGLIAGQWIDKKYQSAPWGVLVGSLLGLSSGMYLLIRDGLRMNKD